MHLFVDESGSFIIPAPGRHAMCCVAALAVPDHALGRLHDLHESLLHEWQPPEGEIKGRDLDERKFRRIFNALHRLDSIAVIVAVDMGLQEEDRVTQHKLSQAEHLRESVAGGEHLPSMRKSVNELADQMEAQPNQLYVQSYVQLEAIDRMIRSCTIHYAQTAPASLGAFAWRVDAKDRATQECERLWSTLEKPFLQTMSMKRRHLYVVDPRFDYSAMDRFHNPPTDAPPAHLAAASSHRAGEPYLSSDLRGLVDDLKFVDSRSSPGVQFADTVASAFCRACNARLQSRGWDRLGRLLIRLPDDRTAVDYLSLSRTPLPIRLAEQPYGSVVLRLERDAGNWEVRRRA